MKATDSALVDPNNPPSGPTLTPPPSIRGKPIIHLRYQECDALSLRSTLTDSDLFPGGRNFHVRSACCGTRVSLINQCFDATG